MPLYVRDEMVRALAARLAERRNCSVTEAVRAALREALAHDAAERNARREAARAILAEFDAAPGRRLDFDDRDLYDENGLPVA